MKNDFAVRDSKLISRFGHAL